MTIPLAAAFMRLFGMRVEASQDASDAGGDDIEPTHSADSYYDFGHAALERGHFSNASRAFCNARSAPGYIAGDEREFLAIASLVDCSIGAGTNCRLEYAEHVCRNHRFVPGLKELAKEYRRRGEFERARNIEEHVSSI